MKQKQAVRAKFREVVFKRDNNKCRVCKTSGKLDAHHITDRNELPNGGYVLENGISLCEPCHWKAEQFHATGEALPGFHPDDLYILIGSTREKAEKASLLL
jgi:5-methylcytosine-specific restriction endonuclease McrA